MSKYRDLMLFADKLVSNAKENMDELKPELQVKLLADVSVLRQMAKNKNNVNIDKMREIAYEIKSIAAPLDMPEVSQAADLLWRVLEMVPADQKLDVILESYCRTVDILVREAKAGKGEQGKVLIHALFELFAKHQKMWGN